MKETTVHVIDDDEAIRDALSWRLRSRGFSAHTWDSGEAFLGALSDAMRGSIVLDVRMEGLSGIEVFDQLIARGCRMPGTGPVPAW